MVEIKYFKLFLPHSSFSCSEVGVGWGGLSAGLKLYRAREGGRETEHTQTPTEVLCGAFR